MKRVLTLLFVFFIQPAFAAEEASPLQFYNAELSQYTDAPGIATEIDVSVNGTIARTRVIQYFANDTQEWQEGKYTYPLPENAAVDKLVMVIGERRIVGFVAHREKARKIYEQAKKEGKATSLVEQRRDNLFHTSVANIPPQSLIAIEIGYQHDIAVDGHDLSLRIPMAVTPRYDEFSPADFITLASAEQGRAAEEIVERLALMNFSDGANPVALRASLRPGFALGNVTSPSHKINVNEEDGITEVSTEQRILKGEQDFVLHWSPQNKDKPLSFIHSEEIDGSVYTHLVVMPPKDAQDFAPKKTKPRQVSFIIDISGSMGGPSIRQAKAAMIEAVQDLDDDDYFTLTSFESVTEWLFDQPVQATAANRKEALKWIAGLDARGGTVMQPALERALSEDHKSGYLRQIVFMTDGAIGYEGKLASYIQDNVGQARFYAVGIGAAPNAYFMRLVAESGRGTFTFIADVKETEKTMRELFKKMKSPVLTDLALHMPDGISAETTPAKIPDLMAGEALSVAIKSDRPLYDLTLTGWRGTKSWKQNIDTDDAAKEASEGIGRIYARRKIQEIKFSDPAAANPETESRITALGIDHQIMSDYTSFVAVDEKILRPHGEQIVTKRYNPNLPKGWELAAFSPREAARAYDEYLQEQAAKQDESQNNLKHDINLPQTATNWMVRLVLSLMMIGLSLFMQGRALIRRWLFD